MVTTGPAHAGRVAVVVVPRFEPARFAATGAVGEFVAGAGPKVSRKAALAALETGKVRSSLFGGKPNYLAAIQQLQAALYAGAA